MADLTEQNQINGGDGGDGGSVGSKRQRRPSVRLGDLGGSDHLSTYYYDHLPRQQRRRRKQPSKVGKEGKEALSDAAIDVNNDKDNLIKGKKNLKKKIDSIDENNEDDEGDLDGVVIGSWKARVLASKGGINGKSVVDEVNKDFEPIRSEEEEEEDKEENYDEGSPVHLFDQDRSDSDDFDDNVGEKGVDGKLSDGKDLRFQVSDEMDDDMSGGLKKNEVKVWLKKLGLERYGPVFEIHEVDDEVLPFLTLEDLKEMGIAAVGSRRKMFCAIKKLKDFEDLKEL